MKKVTKVLIGVVVSSFIALSLKSREDEKIKKIISSILFEAKKQVNNEVVTGTWIDMTPKWVDELKDYIFAGGILTSTNTYDFTAYCKNGEIVSFKNQQRLNAVHHD